MAFAYKRALTIDHTKCGSADSSSFPFYFPGASYLAMVANGGKVQNASGYDIGFYADSALTTKLAWETVSWSASTGTGEWHIKVPTLSTSADTVIYVAYGDASITTDQSNKTAVWDSDFKAVYHAGDGTTLSLSDSTSNANSATNHGTTPVSGQTGGGLNFTSASSQYVTVGSNTSVTNLATLTVSAWTKVSSLGSGDQVMVSEWSGVGTNEVWNLYIDSSSRVHLLWSNNGSYSGAGDVAVSSAITRNVWTHVAAVISDSTGTLLVNGLQVASGGSISLAGSGIVEFGRDDQGNNYFDGSLDEIRISSTARSASWVLAEYNNQSSPSTFYSIGAEQAITAGSNALFWLGD